MGLALPESSLSRHRGQASIPPRTQNVRREQRPARMSQPSRTRTADYHIPYSAIFINSQWYGLETGGGTLEVGRAVRRGIDSVGFAVEVSVEKRIGRTKTRASTQADPPLLPDAFHDAHARLRGHNACQLESGRFIERAEFGFRSYAATGADEHVHVISRHALAGLRLIDASTGDLGLGALRRGLLLCRSRPRLCSWRGRRFFRGFSPRESARRRERPPRNFPSCR